MIDRVLLSASAVNEANQIRTRPVRQEPFLEPPKDQRTNRERSQSAVRSPEVRRLAGELRAGFGREYIIESSQVTPIAPSFGSHAGQFKETQSGARLSEKTPHVVEAVESMKSQTSGLMASTYSSDGSIRKIFSSAGQPRGTLLNDMA